MMIQTIRDLSKSWVVKTLMGLLVVSFAIWGIGDMFRGNPLKRTVAKAGNISISVQELEYEFQKNMADVRRNFGPEVTIQQAKQMGLLDRTLDTMIERYIMNQSINSMGIKVSESSVLKKIAEQPSFRDKEGKFNQPLWQSILRQYGLSEAQFVQNEKMGEAQQELIMALTANAQTPKLVLDNIYKARGQKRILEVISFPNSSVGSIPAPDENTLKEYHAAHGDKFTSPEYRTVTVAKLSASDAVKDISISEDDLKKAFDEKIAELAVPEQRDLMQIVTQDEAKAKQFAEAAKEGKDFSAVAKSNGLEAVDINKAEEKDGIGDLYGLAFKLNEKQVSDPVKTDLGWHVVTVKKIYPASEPKFADVKDKLRTQLQHEMSVDAVTRTVNQLDDALAAGQQLEEVADSLKLRLIKIPSLTADGKTADGKDPAELPAKDEVIRAAFSQAGGETSQVIEDKSGQGSNYIVVRTDEVSPSQVRPFDQVRSSVLTLWSAEAQAKQAAEEAEKIAQAMRDGKQASTFAARSGIDIRLSKPISLLGETDKELPQSALPQIFKMQKGDIITTTDANNKQFVLRMAEIEAVDPAKPGEEYQLLSKEMSKQLPQNFFEEFYVQMLLRFPVRVNQELLASLRQEGSQ